MDYIVGQKVWLKVKHYKTGQTRKLAPLNDGPWTIVENLPNGAYFCFETSHEERKVVHHDHLAPVIHNEPSTTLPNQERLPTEPSPDDSDRFVASDYPSKELKYESDSSAESNIAQNHKRLRP